MQIGGKEIKMRYSVRARLKIAALCPGKKLNNLDQLLSGSEEETVKALVKIGKILNNDYEAHKRLEAGDPVDMDEDYSLFTLDDVLDMEGFEISALESLITYTMFSDGKQTVEAEEPKRRGKKTVKKENQSN